MTIYFPRQHADVHGYDDIAPAGVLVLDDEGCLRMDESGPVIIWPHSGLKVELINGEVVLVDEQSGESIAAVGDEVVFQGSISDQIPTVSLESPLPEACADAGRYLVTGPVSKSEPQQPS